MPHAPLWSAPHAQVASTRVLRRELHTLGFVTERESPRVLTYICESRYILYCSTKNIKDSECAMLVDQVSASAASISGHSSGAPAVRERKNSPPSSRTLTMYINHNINRIE